MVTGVIKMFDTNKKYTYCYLSGQSQNCLLLHKKEYLAVLMIYRSIYTYIHGTKELDNYLIVIKIAYI